MRGLNSKPFIWSQEALRVKALRVKLIRTHVNMSYLAKAYENRIQKGCNNCITIYICFIN